VVRAGQGAWIEGKGKAMRTEGGKRAMVWQDHRQGQGQGREHGQSVRTQQEYGQGARARQGA
jgi:hypothetical protein